MRRLAVILLFFAWVAFGGAWADFAPSPAGPYAVETALYTWRDAARNRDVPVKVYYPATTDSRCPVIIYSHGLGGTREGYEYLGRCWASHGHVSVHVQHLGSDDVVWKESYLKMRAMRKAAMDPANAINRPKDIRFVIDELQKANGSDPILRNRLDLEKIGVGGHSFGAYTTLAVAGEVFVGPRGRRISLADPRIKAAMPMSSPVPKDRTTFAEAFGQIRIPCFHMTGTKDDSPVGNTKAADRRVPFDFSNGSDQYLVTFTDGDHMIFSGRGRLSGGEKDTFFQELISAAALAFWDAYLKGDPKAKAWLSDGGFDAMLGNSGRFEKK